jgi:hypothetical protein
MPFLTERDFHWAQQLLYVGPRSAIYLYSGRRSVAISSRTGPMSWSFSSLLTSGWIPAGCGYSHNSSYLLDVCPRHDFVEVGTLGIVVEKRHRHCCVFALGAPKWSLTLVGTGSIGRFIPRGFWNSWTRVVSAQVELLSVELLMEMF